MATQARHPERLRRFSYACWAPILKRKEDAVRIEHWARAAFGLGVLSLLAVLVSHLALTDIYHAEGDLSLEWSVLRVCFGIIIAFQIVTLLTLRKILRKPDNAAASPA
jgi:uncharacterized membrane protein YhhN